jgi:hypothetical protein
MKLAAGARRPSGAITLAALVGVLMCAGCASEPVDPDRGGSTNRAAKISHGGSAQITARVVLDETTAPADGKPIHGYLEVTNASGEPLAIPSACNGVLAVGLTNKQVGFDPGFTEMSCAAGHLPVGKSRTRIQVATTYDECHQGVRADGSRTPRCLGPDHNVMPPLAPGRYVTKAVFTGVRPDIPAPHAIAVTLVGP